MRLGPAMGIGRVQPCCAASWCYYGATQGDPGCAHMTTTSIKLPEELKARAAAMAQERGVTPHAFRVQAIAAATAVAEQRAAFVAEALAAQAQMVATGKGFDADDVHAWLRARAASQPARKPRLKSWRA